MQKEVLMNVKFSGSLQQWWLLYWNDDCMAYSGTFSATQWHKIKLTNMKTKFKLKSKEGEQIKK